MATEQVDKVNFVNVPGGFKPGETLLVFYKLADGYEVHGRDWVGLFRVGWSSSRDYYTFEWASTKDEEGRERSVRFTGSRLPPDDGQFYQFCYVSKSGAIKGASRPFQFSASVRGAVSEDMEVVEINEEDSLVLLRSKQDAQVSELEKKVTELMQTKVNVEESFVKVKTENERVLSEKTELENEMKELLVEVEDARKEIEEKIAEIATLKEDIAGKNAIISNLNTVIEDYKQKLLSFEDTFKERGHEFEQLQKSKDALKHELDDVTSHLQQIQVFSDRKEDELIAAQNTIKQLKEENETLQTEKVESETLLRTHCSQLEESQRKLEEDKEALIGRSEYYEAEAERNQQTIEVMKVQVSSLENDLSELNKELDKEKAENQSLAKQLVSKEQEYNVMQQNVCEMAGNIKEPRDSLPDVPVTDKVDKSVFDAMRMAFEDIGDQLKNEKKINHSQKRKIAEMEQRIKLCQEEYRNIATENAHLQKKFKKSGSSTPTGSTQPSEKAKLEHELEQFQLMHDRKIAEKNEVVEQQKEEIETLEEENRKLHDKVDGLTHQETAMKRSIETLNVENEQLKKQLREIKQSLPKYTPPTAPPPPYGPGYRPDSRTVHPPAPQRPPHHGGYAAPTQHCIHPQPQPFDRDGANGTRQCPMCQLAFPARTSQHVFEQHVNSHFGN
ncbi:PREDICTED: calcium-binding and coiled-coil domain-containing protein 2-like [Amphimedon queenslandica]|uniref:UBZ1-type domain-containing protein n=1 Tax=Amphimedon queenslandica TaxID=400682 RepID=A0A1X7TZ18_AMPQE|nr:PREDICTED: calcium-binding and coiled-coil domain-containing protein 2-like [Amphimedon queenslandica]|eukprot:XP_003389467.1 PREDICTED: calcium-binding and coiled-coil domain-containing protein 2-like [Amphimedon queenslandica]